MFQHGVGINGQRIKKILQDESLVPTRVSNLCINLGFISDHFNQNAFSLRFLTYIFNFFSMFVVDLLHEFELGVWKAIFIHLMRILFAAGGTAVQELNYRYVIMLFEIVHQLNDYIQVPSSSYFW
jgi:hypothetical protein